MKTQFVLDALDQAIWQRKAPAPITNAKIL
jgi:hypothetical protein